MKYVILNVETGMYVAPPGSAHSYVKNLRDARTFSSVEAAEQEMCWGNERVLSLEEAIRG